MQVVQEQKNKENGILIQSTFQRSKPVLFPIDNVDLAIDTPDGKRQFHDMATVVYQVIVEGRAVSYFF